MKRSDYKKIIYSIDKCEEDDCLVYLTIKYAKFQRNTLGSIYALELQHKVRRNYHRVCNSDCPDIINQLYNRYLTCVESNAPNGIILRLAKEVDFSPAMLAKLMLEHFMSIRSENSGAKIQINQLLRETSLIPDKNLAYEVYLCQLTDCAYGPFADSIKHSVGHEYELLLKRRLKEMDISYHDEHDLRSKGFDKTPDVKLEIPIAVGGRVINWIESKASFGDDEMHKKNLKEQFWSYWNRFGAGLVIYWFGFIDELDDLTDKGILLRDSFPSDIVQMDLG